MTTTSVLFTYEEMAEVKAKYYELAKMQMDAPPDTTEFEKWLTSWMTKKGLAPPVSWSKLRIHVVPSEEHKHAR